MKSFKELIKNAPESFGIYKFLDKNHNILYIGKARNLKKRLTDHLKNLEQKSIFVISQTFHIEWELCKNELEAQILEQKLIKKEQPKYNILLKDDKSFPVIYFENWHNFPAIRYQRKKIIQSNIECYGPFPNSRHTKNVVDLIKNTLMIRGCANSDFSSRKRPCIEFQMKRCTAPCMGYVTQKEYLEQIEDAKLILTGQNDILKEKLSKKLEQHILKNELELAESIRSNIESLTYITNSVVEKNKKKNKLAKKNSINIKTNQNKDFLDKIKRLGKKRKKALLLNFGSIKAIKNASIIDIMKVNGIGLYFAKLIFQSK